jgi:GH35 family endo-1,4-beta-xylanase
MKINHLKICSLAGLFIVIAPVQLRAQQEGKTTEEISSSALGYLGNSPKEIRQKRALEIKYLKRAQENIELYRKGDGKLVIIDREGNPLKNINILINQTSQDFLFGNLSEEVIDLSPEDAKKFEKWFTGLFNFTELTVKWQPYEPEQGKPEWQKLQEKLDWCKRNHITPKGHTLGWTHRAGTPDWLLELPSDMANQLYKARILNLVAGFKDQIKIWDVVNEPVNTIPWDMALKDTTIAEAMIDDGIRYDTENVTLNQTLPWVENSFLWSAQADKDGDFILNEFYLIAKPDAREKFYLLMKELKSKSIPVKGIGIQGHEPRDMWFSPVELIKTFDRLNDFELPLHITEFIPQSSGKPISGGWRKGNWTLEAQAEFAEQFYTLAFGYPSMASIHWWGLSDKNIWLKGGGLLDKNYDPKPVYNRLLKLIKEDWMTKNLHLKTNSKGEISFRGFYGHYKIEIQDGSGKIHKKYLHLKKEENNLYNLKI